MQPIRPNASKLVGAGCQMIFGLVFTGFSVVWLLAVWSLGAPWYFYLFDLPFLGVGLGLLGNGAWGLIVRPSLVGMAFGPAAVDVQPTTARVGDAVRVRYEQAARRNLDVRGVRISLTLREHATYRRGTNTYTAQHDQVIAQYEAPGRVLTSGGLLTEECSLQIPTNAMHSFEASRNKLIWLIQIVVDTPASPDVSEEFPIRVVPDVAGAG